MKDSATNKTTEQVSEMEPAFSVSLTKKGLYGMIKIQELENIIDSNLIKWTKSSKLTGENYIPKHFFEKCYNILNCVVESKDGTVSRNMFAKIDSHYPEYIRFLTELELMECTDSNYSIYKHISKKYKVSEIILNSEKCEIVDERLINFLERMKQIKMKEFNKYNNAKKVTIGLTKSYVYSALMDHFAHLPKIERDENIKMAYANYCQINENKLFGAIENDSRLHSNFTRIPKCIRRLVYNGNEELVEFDIHATHIFLLPKAIENMLIGEANKKNAGLRHLSESRIAKIRKDLNCFTDMLESCFNSDSDVYSEFAKEYGTDITREDIKINLLAWINNETGFGYDKIDKLFDTLFPNIKQFMKDKKYGGFNLFNFELTRLETGLILPICKEIVKNELTLISVHDCLMFRKKDKEQIFEIIKRHMEAKDCMLLTWKEKKFNWNSSLENVATLPASQSSKFVSVVIMKNYTQRIILTTATAHSYFVCNLEKDDTKNDGSTSGAIVNTSLSVAKVTIDKIREVNNNGSRAWEYRGTGNQRMKASLTKMDKKQFLDKVNEKFINGEWK